MYSRHGYFMGAALALGVIFVAAIAYVDRMFGAFFRYIAPAFEPRFTFNGLDLSYAGGGEPIDPAVLQSLRHEAGTRRMSAARNV